MTTKRRPTPLRPNRGHVPDPEYLAWIRTQPCIMCTGWIDPTVEAHHYGGRAFGTKAPDRLAIPLCLWHHTIGPSSVHKLGKGWADRHGLDMREVFRDLWRRYEEYRSKGERH